MCSHHFDPLFDVLIDSARSPSSSRARRAIAASIDSIGQRDAPCHAIHFRIFLLVAPLRSRSLRAAADDSIFELLFGAESSAVRLGMSLAAASEIGRHTLAAIRHFPRTRSAHLRA